MLSYHNVGDAVCGRCCLTTPIMWEMLSVCLTNNVGDAVCLTPIMWEMLSHHSYNVGDAVLPLRWRGRCCPRCVACCCVASSPGSCEYQSWAAACHRRAIRRCGSPGHLWRSADGQTRCPLPCPGARRCARRAWRTHTHRIWPLTFDLYCVCVCSTANMRQGSDCILITDIYTLMQNHI